MPLLPLAGLLGLALGPALWRVTAAAAWSRGHLSGFVPAQKAPPMRCSMALDSMASAILCGIKSAAECKALHGKSGELARTGPLCFFKPKRHNGLK